MADTENKSENLVITKVYQMAMSLLLLKFHETEIDFENPEAHEKTAEDIQKLIGLLYLVTKKEIIFQHDFELSDIEKAIIKDCYDDVEKELDNLHSDEEGETK